MAIITAESVASAAADIANRGERPTIERIRAELGGGSPNAILPLLNAWKDAQRTQTQQAHAETTDAPQDLAQEIEQPTGIDALPLIGQALDGLINGILSTVNTLIERERTTATATLQATQSAADTRFNLAQAEAAKHLAEIQAEAEATLADSREEAESLADQLTGSLAEIDRLRECFVAQNEEIDTLKRGLAEAVSGRDEAKSLAAELGSQLALIRQKATATEQRNADLVTQIADLKASSAAQVDKLMMLIEQIRSDAADARTAQNAITSGLRDDIAKAEQRAEEAGKRAHAAQVRADNDHAQCQALLIRIAEFNEAPKLPPATKKDKA